MSRQCSLLRDERGQTATLIIGFFAVALLLVVVVVDASAAYLRRQRLDALADGAALAAADGIRSEQVYEGGLGDTAVLDPALARRHVAEHLAAVGARDGYPGLRWTVTTTPDTVTVRVTTPLDLPLSPPGWQPRTTVTGAASATVPVVG